MKHILFILSFLFLYSISYAGGLMVVLPQTHQNPDQVLIPGKPNPALFPLEARSCQIETKIDDLIANTSLKQVFFNPTNRRIEAYFLFPIPEGAVISDFAMEINGKRTEGEMLDAAKAKKIYEDIVRRAKDPALLEFYNRKLFRVRVFPIEPQSEQIIELSYTENLRKEDGFIHYAFPLNTEKYAAKPLNEISFKIDIQSNKELKNILCPTHNAEINLKTDRRATIGFEATNRHSSKDLELFFQTGNGKPGMSLVDFRKSGEEGYFMLNIAPGLAKANEIIEKDIVFVLDASGSMSGDKLDQAKKALNFCINNLNDGDRFNLVRFSTEANALFSGLVKADAKHREEAESFIQSIRPIGGTNIDDALALALNDQPDPNRPKFVVFLTDGKPTIGETQEAKLLEQINGKNTHNTRIFTFGIGYKLNTHLLDKITEATQAYRTYVNEDEDIEIKVSNFFTKIASPVLSDVSVEFDRSVSVSEVYAKSIPDLFQGSSITLMGRYNGHGKSKVTLKGKVNGKTTSFEYDLDFSKENTKHEYIAPLWAARCVGHLLDQVRLHGKNQELIDEIVRLSKQHGIITPYTSYLIIEDEADLISRREIQQGQQLLRNRVQNQRAPAMEQIEEELEDSYSSMAKKESNKSVRASEEIQSLNNASNIDQTQIGQSRLAYRDDQGQMQNLSANIRNVQGRAFYENNNQWVDSNVQKSKDIKWERIAFNSKAYFDLISNTPESIAYLNLGRNVRFNLGKRWIEVYE